MTQVGRRKNAPYSIERSRSPLLDESRQVLSEQDRAIYELYYEKGMTQQEIAEALGISVATINRRFRKYGWKARRIVSRSELDENEIHSLYFKRNLSQKEIANRVGISRKTVERLFQDNEWQVRNRKKHESKTAASRERGKQLRMRVKELRAQLFGTKCRVCGEERKLAIHRKDGEEHDKDVLWRVSYLKSIDSDEWAALCIPCHWGVHWMMSEYDLNWNQIKSLPLRKLESESNPIKTLDIPDKSIPSSQIYQELKSGFEGTKVELRRAIFGDRCHFCGSRHDEKQLLLHRKDGRSHHKDLTIKEKYFRILDPKDWVFLCNHEHRGVHWALDTLGLDWDDLKRKDDGAEGEI